MVKKYTADVYKVILFIFMCQYDVSACIYEIPCIYNFQFTIQGVRKIHRKTLESDSTGSKMVGVH